MSGGIKRTNLDALFSQYIRARAGWCCERCGKYYPPGPGRAGLHCSHLFGRANKSTRVNPQNAFAHCYSCHQYLGANPVLFDDWARGMLGSDTVDALKQQAVTPEKWTKEDEDAAADDLYQRVIELGETPVCTGKKRKASAKSKTGKRAIKTSAPKRKQGKLKRKVDGTVVPRETET